MRVTKNAELIQLFKYSSSVGLGFPTRLERLVAEKPTNMALIISDGPRIPL
jgi:hypothetical protein